MFFRSIVCFDYYGSPVTTLLFLLDGSKYYPELQMILLTWASETYPPEKIKKQRNDCARYERVFRLKITVSSTRPIARSGEGGEEPAMWPWVWVMTIKAPRRPLYNLFQVCFIFFNFLKNKVFFAAATYTSSSKIVACETPHTENGTSPEPNLFMVSLISLFKAYIHPPNRFCTTRKSLKSTPCCVCIP